MTEIRRINSRGELMALARELKVRTDWHEPDEREVRAEVRGKSFDNAGFWGSEREAEMVRRYQSDEAVEMYVTLYQADKPVAEVPLATLFAWATGYEADASPVDAITKDAAWHAAQQMEKVSQELAASARKLRDLSN